MYVDKARSIAKNQWSLWFVCQERIHWCDLVLKRLDLVNPMEYHSAVSQPFGPDQEAEWKKKMKKMRQVLHPASKRETESHTATSYGRASLTLSQPGYRFESSECPGRVTWHALDRLDASLHPRILLLFHQREPHKSPAPWIINFSTHFSPFPYMTTTFMLPCTQLRNRLGEKRPERVRVYLPTVVPAECIEYFKELFCIKRCTSAIWCDTDAVGVPICSLYWPSG